MKNLYSCAFAPMAVLGVWFRGAIFLISLSAYGMEILQNDDRSVTVPIVEYEHEEQLDDPYLYKGLPPRNYIAKTKLSVLQQSVVLEDLQNFDQNLLHSEGRQNALGDMVKYLPSGQKTIAYVDTVLLPIAQKVSKKSDKVPQSITKDQKLDALMDLDYLGFNKDGLRDCVNEFNKDGSLLTEPSLENKFTDKIRLRRVAAIVNKKFSSDVLANKLQDIVEQRKLDNVLNIAELQKDHGLVQLAVDDLANVIQMTICVKKDDLANIKRIKQANELRAIKYDQIKNFNIRFGETYPQIVKWLGLMLSTNIFCYEVVQELYVKCYLLGGSYASTWSNLFFYFCVAINGFIFASIPIQNRFTNNEKDNPFMNSHCRYKQELPNWYKPHKIKCM